MLSRGQLRRARSGKIGAESQELVRRNETLCRCCDSCSLCGSLPGMLSREQISWTSPRWGRSMERRGTTWNNVEQRGKDEKIWQLWQDMRSMIRHDKKWEDTRSKVGLRSRLTLSSVHFLIPYPSCIFLHFSAYLRAFLRPYELWGAEGAWLRRPTWGEQFVRYVVWTVGMLAFEVKTNRKMKLTPRKQGMLPNAKCCNVVKRFEVFSMWSTMACCFFKIDFDFHTIEARSTV